MEESFRLIASPSLREQVAVRIREAIETGRFAAGQRLVERELCELMGVSRTSVREALRELEAEGLVTVVPNRGPIVSTIDVETAESIYQVRVVLEGLATRLFVRRASDEQVRQLRQAVHEVEAAYAGRTAESLVGGKASFYRILFSGAGNEVASAVLRPIHTRISQLRITSLSKADRAQASIRELWELVAAIEARDEERAWRACVLHIEQAARAALDVIRTQGVPARQSGTADPASELA